MVFYDSRGQGPAARIKPVAGGLLPALGDFLLAAVTQTDAGAGLHGVSSRWESLASRAFGLKMAVCFDASKEYLHLTSALFDGRT